MTNVWFSPGNGNYAILNLGQPSSFQGIAVWCLDYYYIYNFFVFYSNTTSNWTAIYNGQPIPYYGPGLGAWSAPGFYTFAQTHTAQYVKFVPGSFQGWVYAGVAFDMLYTISGCQTCSANSYCLNNVSTPCPVNTFSPTGSASLSQCVHCGNGTRQNPNNIYQCIACSAGTYCPAFTTTAIPCPAYNYCPASSTSYITCPDNSFSSPNITNVTACTCINPLVQQNGSCTCLPGTYASVVNKTIGITNSIVSAYSPGAPSVQSGPSVTLFGTTTWGLSGYYFTYTGQNYMILNLGQLTSITGFGTSGSNTGGAQNYVCNYTVSFSADNVN